MKSIGSEALPEREEDAAQSAASLRLHPVLAALFAEFDRREMSWTLPWVPAVPGAPTGDVDLLAAPEDLPSLKAAAAELGFVALPGWESAPALLLVNYDGATDCWLVLDAVAEISYRAVGWSLPERATEEVLRRRQRQHGMSVPADADGFWLLLLHCILDKGRIRDAYRDRLRRLASSAPESTLGSVVCAAAGTEFSPTGFLGAVNSERWPELIHLGSHLASALRRGVPLDQRFRALMPAIARRARKPLLLRRRRGTNVALLGPNGVGKSTAVQAVQDSFPFESRVLYMGVWKAASRDQGPAQRAAEILSRPFRIWGRYLVAQYHQLRGRLVLFDRYVYEALLPPQPPFIAAKRAYFWALAHLIPSPGAGVVLDVPGHVAYARKQENPPAELESERRLYAAVATRVASLELVDADAPPERVRGEINAIVWRRLCERWSGGVRR